MNLETKITIYKFTPQLFTLTHKLLLFLLLIGKEKRLIFSALNISL